MARWFSGVVLWILVCGVWVISMWAHSVAFVGVGLGDLVWRFSVGLGDFWFPGFGFSAVVSCGWGCECVSGVLGVFWGELCFSV